MDAIEVLDRAIHRSGQFDARPDGWDSRRQGMLEELDALVVRRDEMSEWRDMNS